MNLIESLSGPDGDLLALHRVLGGGGIAQGRDDRLARLQIRYQSAATLRAALVRLRAHGFRAMVAINARGLFAAIGPRRAEELPRLIPVIPNIRGFMRDAVEYGMLGAGVRRARRLGPLALAGLGLRGLGRAKPLLRRDFPTMLRCFVELELADFARYDPPLVLLQAQMTDLALAMNNPRIVQVFVDAVRRRTGAVAGFCTVNFALAVERLKGWGIDSGAILTPWDGAGAHLRPDAPACLKAAAASPCPVWAERPGLAEAPGAEERALLHQAGLAGALREDFGLWEAA